MEMSIPRQDETRLESRDDGSHDVSHSGFGVGGLSKT
jgi:hypothetical protein